MNICPHCGEVEAKFGRCPHCTRFCDNYDKLRSALESILSAATGEDLLAIPGMYELAMSEYYADVLADIEQDKEPEHVDE